jgi:hypothetical protein
MSNIEINDKRQKSEFKSITFSKFKKSEAKKELIKCLQSGNIEQSCYWSAEFICSGDFLYLWDIIFFFMSKYIHIGNPKLPLYIDSRLEIFKDIVNKGYSDNILKLRNNIDIRKMFIEIVGILCCSKKKNSYDIPKINDSAFNMIEITHKLVAKHKKAGYKIFQNEDPREIFIAINELAWNIKCKNKDTLRAIYWLEWIIEYEKLCKKKKIIKKCARRNIPVENKFQCDMIWIVWDIILSEAKGQNNGLFKIIKSLLNIFCLKYKNSFKNKRKLLIYNAISLLTETYDTKIIIVKDIKLIEKLKINYNEIYKQIKKNELKPNTNYLFKNVQEKNLESTINKLDKFNSLTYIPRN